MASIEIVLPPRSGDALSQSLRMLTFVLDPDSEAGCGLGGAWGYGAARENATFLMHPFCWCERDGCLWCMPGDHVEFEPLLKERFGTEDYQAHSRRRYYDPPNFWHKPSDFRVTWYKWIGRDMATNRDIAHGELAEMLEAVLASIGAAPLEESWRRYVDMQEAARAEEAAVLQEIARSVSADG